MTFQEIDAYGRLMRVEFDAAFVECLIELDRTFIDACREVKADQTSEN